MMKTPQMQIEQILLYTDLSQNARAAYACAAELASRCHAGLHLVQFGGALPLFVPTGYREKCYDALEQTLRAEATEHPDLAGRDVRCQLLRHRWTRARQQTLETELGADLIVMSPHGQTGLEHVLLGSFADRVVQHSSLPVLLFRPAADSVAFDPELVLVPHDFYDRPRAVIPAIRWLSSIFQARFRFIHVYDQSASELPAIRAIEEQFLQAGRFGTVEERFAKLVDEELEGIDVELETAQGVPSLKIVHRAKELAANLVLLGKREGLGSVAQQTTRQAPCSVLTAPLE